MGWGWSGMWRGWGEVGKKEGKEERKKKVQMAECSQPLVGLRAPLSVVLTSSSAQRCVRHTKADQKWHVKDPIAILSWSLSPSPGAPNIPEGASGRRRRGSSLLVQSFPKSTFL